MMTRKGHDQLPQGQELLEILRREAKRSIAIGKEKQHFADFSPVISWLTEIGVSIDFFASPPKEWLEEAVVMPELGEEIAAKTLEALANKRKTMLPILERVTQYLGESDEPGESDLIFVFGSPSLSRIETAVHLYKQHLAPKIFITGGRPFYKPEADSEAQIYRQYAIENGVPDEAIAVHDNAVSIFDNVRGGLNRLDELGINFRSMILVSSWFVQRRCWAIMKKYTPEGANLFRVNAPTSSTGGLNENDWYTNEKGIKVVSGEFFKLRTSEILNTS